MFDIDFPLLKDVIMKNWVEKKYSRRYSIHCSDLIHCHRKVCYERLDPKSHIIDLSSKTNQRKVRYFILGEAQHRYLSDILGTEDYEYEKEINYTCKTGLNIVGHCDIVDKRDGTVIEIKTAHTTKVLKQPYSYHLRQLQMYLVLTQVKKGILFYIIMGETFNTSEYFVQYNMTLRDEQREEILEEIERNAVELQNGIEQKDPDVVGHIADNLTYINKTNNWYCSSCPYTSTCKGYKEAQKLTSAELMERTFVRIKENQRPHTPRPPKTN